MEVDGAANGETPKVEDEEEVPTCMLLAGMNSVNVLSFALDTSIEAPPSILPPKRYCDITGLEVGECSRQPERLALPPMTSGSVH
jgi:hypothetical protein